MFDPHIDSLIYSLHPSEFVQYDEPPPLKFDTDIFEGTLVKGVEPESVLYEQRSAQRTMNAKKGIRIQNQA